MTEPASQTIAAEIKQGIASIAPEAWQATLPHPHPFVGHGYLNAMEASGSANSETGWVSLPVVVGDPASPDAVAPAYLKSHSYGEYVFDHSWAHAYENAGGRYYPKLQVAVPFTPVTGPRLLARTPERRVQLIAALEAAAQQLHLSSVHATFCEPDEAAMFEEAGWIVRHGIQYHWHDRNFGDFDGFLAALKSAKRKTIRKERRAAEAHGIEFEVLRGAEITPEHLDAFYPFYRATIDKRVWGNAYLTRDFFRRLGDGLGDALVFTLAKDEGRYVAGAMHVIGGDTLYGRVWGCLGDYKFLHFELCYYQAIDVALRWGLKRVEAGAQGEHKLQRGYAPSLTYSAHWIADPKLAEPVAGFCARERRHIAAELPALEGYLPYRNAEADG